MPIGNSGEILDEVIEEINHFTDENYGEVILLQFRYLSGIRNVPSLGPLYWDEVIIDDFFDRLKQIKRRCPNLNDGTVIGMDETRIGDFMDMNGGQGCVLFFLHQKNLHSTNPDLFSRISPADGIYQKDGIAFTDAWSEKEDTDEMAEWEINSWETKDRYHVCQWICTLGVYSSTFMYGIESVAVLPTNPALYWRRVNIFNPSKFPNEILVDYLAQVLLAEAGWEDLSAELYTLAIGLNRYTVSENCDYVTVTSTKNGLRCFRAKTGKRGSLTRIPLFRPGKVSSSPMEPRQN